MCEELIFTSAPRGLHPGSQGYCTVAQTRGLGVVWRQRIEELSGSRGSAVAFSHLRIRGEGGTRSVLSRVAPVDREYTGRTNVFAHHVVLDPGERPASGPAWLLSQPGF